MLLVCGAIASACTRRDDARVVRGPVEAAPGACPRFLAPMQVGVVASPAIVEASGLAASVRHPGIFWTHNDSGDRARVFALRDDGSLAAELALEGVTATDIEDVAVGPCGEGSCVFVADIGDNRAERPEVALHRFPEPEALTSGSVRVQTTRFRYEDGPRNAETLLVEPRSGDVFVVSKTKQGPSALYRLPSGGGVATREGGVTPPLGSNQITAGSFARSGARLALRTYTHAFLYEVAPGASLAVALARPPCVIPAPEEPQGEALAFTESGAIRFLSEGERVPIYEVRPSP
jgi:hypothetical protein